MQLDQADIKEFKELYEKEFEEQIDWSEAERMAGNVMNLFEAVYECGQQQLTSTDPVLEAQAHTSRPDA